MELSGRDSLSATPWLDDDHVHGLPLIEDDALSHSLASAPMLDHDDVNALFPLLGDSSLECEGDQAFEGDPEQPPFDSDLSPIFAAKTAPLGAMTRHRLTSTSAASVGKQQQRLRSRRRALEPVQHSDAGASPASPVARRTKRRQSFQTPVSSSNSNSYNSTSGSVLKRKRTAGSEPVAALVSTLWTEQEQSVFFSTFKTKWPVDDRASVASAGASRDVVLRAPSFSTLLLERFDAISKRVKTKSVLEVRQFYTLVLGSISVLLREVEHDVNLTNPDQVRIAVWCWSKLVTDDVYKNDFQQLGTADPATKLRLAHLLLQTIIRSRRQMLKAKSFAGGVYNGVSSVSATPLPSVLREERPAESSVQSDAVASLPTTHVVAPPRPAAAVDAAPVVHHPMVRKKSVAKRRRLESDATGEEVSVSVDETPLKRKRPLSEVAFASPAPTQFHIVPQLSQPQPQLEPQPQALAPTYMTLQTPPRSSKKKMFIKMRMVPLDEHVKAHVARAGCNPKVELKLTATKKVSEVAQHMAAKWAHVRAFVPANAQLLFHEQQQLKTVGSSDSDSVDERVGCWSESDRTVTCFDIWKRGGKQVKNENVVVVYYSWGEPATARSFQDKQAPPTATPDAVARSPGRLFADEMRHANVSAAGATSTTCGLQQFGERLAFHRSEFIDAHDDGHSSVCDKTTTATTTTATTATTAGVACPLEALLDENDDDDNGAAMVESSPYTRRLRRRITPVLVPTQEFDL